MVPVKYKNQYRYTYLYLYNYHNQYTKCLKIRVNIINTSTSFKKYNNTNLY